MQIEKFKKYLNDNAKKLNIKLTDEEIEMFYKYMNLLNEWNEKINLTAIRDPEEIILKHFIDSLTILKWIKNGDKVIDIGTGAGFPGMPIKIINKEINMTLLDSVNKKIIFLDEVKKELKLNHLETTHGRAEEYGQNLEYREKYDVCISRAVAPLNILLEYMLPFVKKNGICICMKGPNMEEESKQAETALKSLGGVIETVEKLSLSTDTNQRNIIIVRKISATPKQYPRKPGLSRKKPL